MNKPSRPRFFRETVLAVFLGVLLGVAFSFANDPDLLARLFPRPVRGQPPATATAVPPTARPAAAAPTQTPHPSETPSQTSPATPTSPPDNATTAPPTTPASPAGMALIPAGFFQMGSEAETFYEAPVHPVLLDAYYLDLYEVTNAQYQACVAAGACSESRRRNSFTRDGYSQDPAFAGYPVIGVTWDQAQAYCAWAGRRLPTEAEWEYAARGPQNWRWPWGNDFDLLRLSAGERDTQPVGSYPEGASVFGVFDLAGNVREWVADAYQAEFYTNAPPRNPRSDNGERRLYRGGSFANLDPALYTTPRRIVNVRGYYDVDLGFRCAQDVTPPEARAASTEMVNQFCQVYLAYKPDTPCP